MSLPTKSRHGLTRCRACRAHIHAADTPSATTCPFCGANLREGGSVFSLQTGRSGLLAGALLAFSASCGGAQTDDATTEPDDTATDTADDTASGDQYDPAPIDDNAAVAEYGMPADDQYEPETAPDDTPTPRYGLPPGAP